MASPYRRRYNDLLQQESDQKDVIISKLKASAFELHQNEKDCDNLGLRLTNLNHRLNLLQKEKALDEQEYSHRNDLNTKTIYNLRKEIEALESELAGIESDIRLSASDNDSVNRTIGSRSAELAKLKCELADLSDDNKLLTLENKELQQQVNKLKVEVQEDIEYNQQINAKVEEATRKQEITRKLIKELEGDEEKLLKQNNELKAQQKDLRLTIADRLDAIKDNEEALAEDKKDVAALQARLDNQRRANEKLKNDIAAGQQELKEENARAADQSTRVKALEALNEEKEDEIIELRRQIAQLRKENDDILDQNDDLENDIVASNKHLDSLTFEHHELIDELEKFNAEDAHVRRVLQRESRVVQTKTKYDDKVKSSLSVMNSSLQSPAKTNATSALSKASY